MIPGIIIYFLCMFFVKLERGIFRGTGMAQLVRHLTLGFGSGHGLTALWVQAPHWALCWEYGACWGFSLSLSLSAPPPLMLSLSLSNKWSQKKFFKWKEILILWLFLVFFPPLDLELHEISKEVHLSVRFFFSVPQTHDRYTINIGRCYGLSVCVLSKS